MDVHSIRHPWFSPTIPKRKHDRDFDNESEWPSAGLPLSAPALEPRPTKRLRHIEGGLAKLSLRPKDLNEPDAIEIDPETLVSSAPGLTNLVSGSPSREGTGPIFYEYTSPQADMGSSAALPLRGEVYEVNTSDEERGVRDDLEQRQSRMMGNSVIVHSAEGMPGYTVQEPEISHEKRKRAIEDDEHGLEKKEKRSWYEPEKDRIVVLDLDSSEDESATNSPRRRRSASSHSPISPTRTHSRIQTQDTPGYVINPTLLSYISPGTGVPSIPREDNPAQALVLYKPPPWAAGALPTDEPEVVDIEDVSSYCEPESIEPSPSIQGDDDAMDIDS